MKNVTKMLSQIEQGDPAAAEQLLPLVYDDLRRLAAKKLAYEKAGLTLQATELVHEGYMRLVGPSGNRCFANRRHFYAAASEAMRRILIDRARRKQACKHGGDWHRLAVSPDVVGVSEDPKLLISLRELLKELTDRHPRSAEVARLRLFLQMTHQEIGTIVGISEDTARADWLYARAWLRNAWENS